MVCIPDAVPYRLVILRHKLRTRWKAFVHRHITACDVNNLRILHEFVEALMPAVPQVHIPTDDILRYEPAVLMHHVIRLTTDNKATDQEYAWKHELSSYADASEDDAFSWNSEWSLQYYSGSEWRAVKSCHKTSDCSSCKSDNEAYRDRWNIITYMQRTAAEWCELWTSNDFHHTCSQHEWCCT